jgi:hypothetical protein
MRLRRKRCDLGDDAGHAHRHMAGVPPGREVTDFNDSSTLIFNPAALSPLMLEFSICFRKRDRALDSAG